MTIKPGFSAGGDSLIIAHLTTVLPEPAESAFDHPAPWQCGKTLNIAGTLDDFHLQLGRRLRTHCANFGPL